MSPDDTTSTPKKRLSGAQLRKRRVERGLPKFSPSEQAAKQKADRDRAAKNAAGRRAFVRQLKLSQGCIDCGYKAHPDALEFDHLPGMPKCGNIGALAGGASMEALIAEIAKCEVVCANCHAIRTQQRKRERRK